MKPSLKVFNAGCLVGAMVLVAVSILVPDWPLRLRARLTGRDGFAERIYRNQRTMLDRADWTIPPGSVLMFGDSITEGLCTEAVGPDVVNLGIGTDTIMGVAERIDDIESLATCRAVIIAVGTVDLGLGCDPEQFKARMMRLIQLVEERTTGPIVLCAVLPVGVQSSNSARRNAHLSVVNPWMKEFCAQGPRRTFVPVPEAFGDGPLPDWAHIGDGTHLSAAGYREWVKVLSAAWSCLDSPTGGAGPNPGPATRVSP